MLHFARMMLVAAMLGVAALGRVLRGRSQEMSCLARVQLPDRPP
jgi:hypothetical protein